MLLFNLLCQRSNPAERCLLRSRIFFSTCPVVGNSKKMNTVCDANAIAHIIKNGLFAKLDGVTAFA